MATTFSINGSGDVLVAGKGGEKSSDATRERTAEKASRTVNVMQGKGLDLEEQRLNVLDAFSKGTERIYSLEYDISDYHKNHRPEDEEHDSLYGLSCEPCPLLYRVAAHRQLSGWDLPESGLNNPRVQDLIAYWQRHGVEVDVIEYAESQLKKVRARARRKMEERVIEIHGSLIHRLGSASDRLDAARKELDKECEEGKEVPYVYYERAEEKWESAVKGVIKESADDLAAAIECAELFDDTEHLEPLFAGLRAALRSEALALNAQLQAKAAKASKAAPVMPEMEKGTPTSYALSLEMRQYTFFPLKGGETVVLICTGGQRKTREELPVAEARKVYARLKREGWKPC